MKPKSQPMALEQALHHARIDGWHFFPIAGNKQPPRGFKWKELSSSKEEAVQQWHKQHGQLAINCELSRLVVVDVDVKHLADQPPLVQANCKALVQKLVFLANGNYAITPSGGFHIFYCVPALDFQPKNMKLASEKRPFSVFTEACPKPWIETKAKGGYVVAYQHAPRKDDGLGLLKEMPWMVMKEMLAHMRYPVTFIDKLWRRGMMLHDACADIHFSKDGERNDVLNAVAYAMFNAGFQDKSVQLTLRHAAIKRGLHESEVDATINSALGGAGPQEAAAPMQAAPTALEAVQQEMAAARAQAAKDVNARAQEAAKPCLAQAMQEAREGKVQPGVPLDMQQAINANSTMDMNTGQRKVIFHAALAALHPGLGYYRNMGSKKVDTDGVWLEWQDGRHTELDEADVQDRADALVAAAGPFADEVHERKMVAAVKRLARVQRRGTTADIDANPNLILDAAGQCIDLRTGQLVEQRQDVPLRRRLNAVWEENAVCPLWEESMDMWMGGDSEMVRYLQRLQGYELLPHNNERLFIIHWGRGTNGKTTFVATGHDVLGKMYARMMNCMPFIKQGHTSKVDFQALASMEGMRAVALSELPERSRWETELIKTATGDIELEVRQLYERFKMIPVSFLISAVGNSRPSFRDASEGLLSRLRFVPWQHIIPKEKKVRGYKDKLVQERNGILQWRLRGLREYLAIGEACPPGVREATDLYASDQGAPERVFAKDCLAHEQGHHETLAAVFNRYMQWRLATGEDKDADSQARERWLRPKFLEEQLRLCLPAGSVGYHNGSNGRQKHILNHRLLELGSNPPAPTQSIPFTDEENPPW